MSAVRTVAAVAAYATTIGTANWLTSRYGLIPIGFGLTATAGTLAAGAAFLARDWVQDTCGRVWAVAGIAAGTMLTAVTAPALAVASATAFLVAEAADMAVYTPLRSRGWAGAVLASGAVGAVVDTLLFLWLAGFSVSVPVVGGQLVGKVVWATVLPTVAVLSVRGVRRVVPGHSLGA
ncbi:VUT family protein [Streptomyces sp. NPDC047315]|uniref:VUT family protein n=1 Tax=Streptomyces sp. NPDC047315 TaxID=3155142 RepID=UPI0033D5CB6D